MKKHFTITLIALFAMGNVAFSQNAFILHDKQINKFAAAIWETVSTDQCIVTDVIVQTGETKQQVNAGGKPFSSTFTYIHYSIADYCNLEYLYYSDTAIWIGSPIADNLTTASTDVTFPIYEWVSGTTSNIHINLSWNSNSKMVTGELDNAHLNLKGIHIGANDHGIYRTADITGFITLGGGSTSIVDNNPMIAYLIKGGPSDIINIHPRMAQPTTGAAIVSVYPNPVVNALHLDASNVSGYSIVNMVGSVVLQRSMEGKTSEDINVSSFDSGIYFIHLQTAQGLVVKKSVKE